MDYFSAVVLGTRTLGRGIFSTPSYPERAGAPCVPFCGMHGAFWKIRGEGQPQMFS